MQVHESADQQCSSVKRVQESKSRCTCKVEEGPLSYFCGLSAASANKTVTEDALVAEDAIHVVLSVVQKVAKVVGA